MLHNRLDKLSLFPFRILRKSGKSDSDDTIDTDNVKKLALIQSLIILWGVLCKKKSAKIYRFAERLWELDETNKTNNK
jgi:hypothetical protein